MWHSRLWISSLVIFLLASLHLASRVLEEDDNSIQTSVFLSPPFFLRPGSVVNKFLFDVPFPRGHIALKSFNAEVVDAMGVPVPLFETYLHHWVVDRYYGEKAAQADVDFSKIIVARNSGVCNDTLDQYFGLGSETQRTSTFVPDPYGIEAGDPKAVPNGYEERWLLNIHAMDTRGVKDRLGCTECKCSLYNVTEDEHGRPLRKDYIGGLYCCYDKTQCQLKEGFNSGEIRTLYLRYTVKWALWDETIVPVKIYIFDVTDTRKTSDASSGTSALSCKVEYQINPCDPEEVHNGECVHTKKARSAIPRGGDIVYGVAHQHSGGIGAALYGQDEKLLCASIPTYGDGEEAGYIVGMSTCYPKPGSVKVADGELLALVSNYNSTHMHTGVMGLFYILVAEPQPQPQPKSSLLFHNLTSPWKVVREYWWALFALVGGIAAVIIGIVYMRKHGDGYRSL